MYIQLWQSYKDFSQKMYVLLKNYQNYLVEKNIKTGKITYNILSIIQFCMFYSKIIGNGKNNIINDCSDELNDIDKRNIEQLIDYIDSIRAFMIMKDFANVDRDKLTTIIKNIMCKTSIVYIMCLHLHNLLKNITNKQAVMDETEYETVIANDVEKKNYSKYL